MLQAAKLLFLQEVLPGWDLEVISLWDLGLVCLWDLGMVFLWDLGMAWRSRLSSSEFILSGHIPHAHLPGKGILLTFLILNLDHNPQLTPIKCHSYGCIWPQGYGRIAEKVKRLWEQLHVYVSTILTDISMTSRLWEICKVTFLLSDWCCRYTGIMGNV